MLTDVSFSTFKIRLRGVGFYYRPYSLATLNQADISTIQPITFVYKVKYGEILS
jgi:hypothetical protein